MTDAELAKTFWPGSRKELVVTAVQLLQNTAGEQRIKMAYMLPLGDGRLVGMPSWVGEGYDLIGKEGTRVKSIKYELDLKEMTMYIHTTEDIEKPAHTIFNVMLTGFVMSRKPEKGDELSDVNLHFEAYMPDDRAFWSWIKLHFRASIFTRFDTTQQELPLEQAPAIEEKQMKLSKDDGYEKERKQATSKSQDAQFANA